MCDISLEARVRIADLIRRSKEIRRKEVDDSNTGGTNVEGLKADVLHLWSCFDRLCPTCEAIRDRLNVYDHTCYDCGEPAAGKCSECSEHTCLDCFKDCHYEECGVIPYLETES